MACSQSHLLAGWLPSNIPRIDALRMLLDLQSCNMAGADRPTALATAKPVVRYMGLGGFARPAQRRTFGIDFTKYLGRRPRAVVGLDRRPRRWHSSSPSRRKRLDTRIVNRQGIKVLVVEDEAIVAQAIRMTLQDKGYEVVGVAGTSEKALGLVEEHEPHLIIMDISIQGDTDGIETARIVRERTGTPVVFLTAYSDDATLDRAREAEPNGFLLKPLDDRSLLPTIEMALHKHQMELERRALTEKLQAALAEIEHLCGLLPICAWCRRVRDDEGYWGELEAYLAKHLNTTYTHGICADCAEKLSAQTDDDS